METQSAKVLKAETIQLQGQYQLEINAAANPIPAGNKARSAPEAAQVRIVETHETHAVMEVICSCGQKTYIQCNYGNNA